MEKKIALWGDSLMKGIVWDEDRRRYCLSHTKAAENAAKKIGIELKNYAKMGCTSTKGMQILQRNLEKEELPFAALIEFGGNDCDFHWAEVAENPQLTHLPNTTLANFEMQIREMVCLLREKGIGVILTTLVPNHAERYFSFITRDGLNGENILDWLGDVQHIYRWHERYNARVEKVARELKCPLIDLREAFLDCWHYEDYLCEDGIHPNEKGYQLMEEVFCTEGQMLAG